MRRTRMRMTAVGLAIAALLASASAAGAQAVHPGEEEGLGLTGPEVPKILQDARRDPYALPPQLDCATLTDQVATLDKILGPDLDAAQQPKAKSSLDPLAAVREFLPYGGVVRFFTGAGRKEQALVHDALAAWERRGFLKAIARSKGCPGFAPIEPAVQAAAAPPTPPASSPPQPAAAGAAADPAAPQR